MAISKTAKTPGSVTKTGKHGISAWTNYVKKELAPLKASNPNFSQKQLMTLLGSNWKASDDNPKKK
ncbi:UNVERIFIED_CONTAM: hypothetical protein HDU68_001043 [Siphonaria sp. JEL0065]|nr:hypothetical protein HDU68_001043 [Siphonaria sp. JEL0065]